MAISGKLAVVFYERNTPSVMVSAMLKVPAYMHTEVLLGLWDSLRNPLPPRLIREALSDHSRPLYAVIGQLYVLLLFM